MINILNCNDEIKKKKKKSIKKRGDIYLILLVVKFR